MSRERNDKKANDEVARLRAENEELRRAIKDWKQKEAKARAAAEQAHDEAPEAFDGPAEPRPLKFLGAPPMPPAPAAPAAPAAPGSIVVNNGAGTVNFYFDGNQPAAGAVTPPPAPPTPAPPKQRESAGPQLPLRVRMREREEQENAAPVEVRQGKKKAKAEAPAAERKINEPEPIADGAPIGNFVQVLLGAF